MYLYKIIFVCAKIIGVNEEDIEYLLSNWYDYFNNINETLYKPDMPKLKFNKAVF